jgi:hypothetical protein
LEVYAQRRSLGEEEQGGKASLKDERTMTWCVVDYLPTKNQVVEKKEMAWTEYHFFQRIKCALRKEYVSKKQAKALLQVLILTYPT